jgi:hypothetical protein
MHTEMVVIDGIVVLLIVVVVMFVVIWVKMMDVK